MDRVQDCFSYVTIDRIVSTIIERSYSYISTVDLASAYQSVLISPEDHSYFGIEWEGRYFVDNFLCFGSRLAPFIFSRLTDAVCRYMNDHGTRCYSYLDDAICLSSSFEEGIRDQLFLIRTLRNLGFYIAWQKVVSPCTVATHLGIVLDIEGKQLRLLHDRIERVRLELSFWENRKKATEKQLSILIGHLCHCAKIIRDGNLYLFHLFEALREAKRKRKIKLLREFFSDLSWWSLSLNHLNFAPMVDTSNRFDTISLDCGYFTLATECDRVGYEIEFPCVRIESETGVDSEYFLFPGMFCRLREDIRGFRCLIT